MRLLPKRYITGVCALMIAATATAQFYTLRVNREDCSHLSVTIKDDMQTGFSDGVMTLTSSLGEITFGIPDVTFWTYSTERYNNAGWLGVDATALPDDLSLSDEMVTLRNLSPATIVTLCDLRGDTLLRLHGDDSYDIPLTDLSAGIYILSYGDKSLKIAVKR
jgi:hypothetical protein